MMTLKTPNFAWDATAFFKKLTTSNRLAAQKGFKFCKVSGLAGFEDAIARFQGRTPIIAVSDISDGYIALDNAPQARRTKEVFLCMPHAIDDMDARKRCFDTLRELFRQFMTRLIRERCSLEENQIFIDQRIRFTEIPAYFYNGAACAYFSIAVNTCTDLRYNPDEWL